MNCNDEETVRDIYVDFLGNGDRSCYEDFFRTTKADGMTKPLNTRDELIEYCEKLGYPKDIIEQLKSAQSSDEISRILDEYQKKSKANYKGQMRALLDELTGDKPKRGNGVTQGDNGWNR